MITLTPRRSRADVRSSLGHTLGTLLDPIYHSAVDPVLRDARFWDAPASAKWHHNYDGGLAEHTLEVVQGVVAIRNLNPELNLDDLLIAATWHDYAKIWDYQKTAPASTDGETFWAHTVHADAHGHIARGYAEFLATARRVGLNDEHALRIGSLILTHHGRREWGSPVEPRSKEAWALHLADMISVRAICNR